MLFHEPIKFCDHHFVMAILDTMLALSEIIHSEKNADTTYHEVIKKISILYEWDYGELWIFDEKQNKLVKSSMHYAKTELSEKFNSDSSEVSFAYDEGLPGKTWKKKKHIWIQNVQDESTFIRRDLAKECGLRTGVTIPILAYDHVEAIMFFFSSEKLNYDPVLVQVLEHLAKNIGLSIVKRDLELQVNTIQGTSGNDQLVYTFIERLFSYRDPYTSQHQIQVAKFATDIAQRMGYDEIAQSHIKAAAMIHDVGKINVPMEILSKPGKLTQSEFNLLKEHPKLGYDIIKNIDLHPSIKRMVLEHHERLDGSGYPNHLMGHDILEETKILTVADVMSAMLENRPYRVALKKSSVKKELLKFRGIFYSPEIVDVALDLLKHHRIAKA